jgi:ABC-type lipoprotein release transport system permease subunit
MLEFKLALKNLLGSGLRTWLNVTVLSIAFVIIIFYNGMLDGWNMQATNDTRAWETGAGQYWHPEYNPYDPFTFSDSHSIPEESIRVLEENGMATPILITQATGYPGGRLVNILLKGISPDQKILSVPTHMFKENPDDPYYIPAVIGKRMAQNSNLKEGDRMLIRWRDANGTFDAREVTISAIFQTTVPTIDAGQIWIPIEKLRELTSMYQEATYFVVSPKADNLPDKTEWIFKNDKALLKDLADIMAAKKGGSRVISSLLLAIALLAIFDTQILSIFRRQKEIGTYIALGMTRMRVVRLFTIEGTTHSFLAILLGMVWGMPILYWIQKTGIPMPANADQAGVAIADKITPYYGGAMIMATVLLVVLSSLIVSYMPTKRISKMKPTDALRGKLI